MCMKCHGVDVVIILDVTFVDRDLKVLVYPRNGKLAIVWMDGLCNVLCSCDV